MGAPKLLAGVQVDAFNETPDAEFTAGRAHNTDVANHQRRERERLADAGVGNLALPCHLAGRLVEREHASVERDRDHLVLP